MSGELIWHLTCFVKSRTLHGHECDMRFIMWWENMCYQAHLVLTLVYGLILGSFHPKHQVCALFRFNTRTPDHYSLLAMAGNFLDWGQSQGRRIYFLWAKEETYFLHLLPSLKENNKGTFLPEQPGRQSDSVFFPLSSNIPDLLFEVVHKYCVLF